MNYISGQGLTGLYKGQQIKGSVEHYKDTDILLMESGKWLPLYKLESPTIVGKNMKEDLKKSIEDNIQMDWKGVSELIKDNKKTPDEVVSFYQDKAKQNVEDAKKNEKDTDMVSREIVLDNLAKASNDGTKGNNDLELEKCVTELETNLVETANTLKKHLNEYDNSFKKAYKEDTPFAEDSLRDITIADSSNTQSSTDIQDFLKLGNDIKEDPLDPNNPEDYITDESYEDLLDDDLIEEDLTDDTLADDTLIEDDLVDDFNSLTLDLDDSFAQEADTIEDSIMSAVDSYDTSNGFSEEDLFNHVVNTLNVGFDFGKSLFETHNRNASDSLVALSEALSLKSSIAQVGDKIAAFFLKLIGFKPGLEKDKMELVGSVKMAASSKIETDDFRDSSKQKQIVNAIHAVLGNNVDPKTAEDVVNNIFYKIIPNHATSVLQASGRNCEVSEVNAKKFYDFNNCAKYIQSIKKQVAA